MEIMIAVALVGILAAVALPSYQNFVIRANRAEAQDALTRVMFEQERLMTRNRTYTDDLAVLGYTVIDIGGGIMALITESGLYRVTAAACLDGAGNAIALTRCVNLTANPAPGTTQENDGNLTLSSQGNKTHGADNFWRER